MKKFVFFWGCVIPTRFPFIEKSTRLVLEDLGIQYEEIEGFTCCPEKFLVETISEEAWYLTAARNLALAERGNCDVLVACNGCYSTFRQAISVFSSNSKLRADVQESLRKIGLEYNFKSRVVHIVEVLYNSIGTDLIGRKTVRPLRGMKFGVHYGCQILKPFPIVRFDDSLQPEKLDKLVECLGGVSLNYNAKTLCCGESLARSGNPEESISTARTKLLELDQLGADALVVICPACFMQFDTQQAVIKKFKEDLHIPVFFYTELLALALGHEPEELGLDMHRVNVQRFFNKWSELDRVSESIPECFDEKAMRTCVECESCANDCPVTQVDEDYKPHDILRGILDGRIDEVLSGKEIWKCLECGTCAELCPNNFGMVKVLKEAKRLAIEKGFSPQEIEQGMELFRKTGMLGRARPRIREKLGLKPISDNKANEINEVLGKFAKKVIELGEDREI